MEASEAAVSIASQYRVPDSRLPGAEVEKKAQSGDDEISVWALWPVFILVILGITAAVVTLAYGPQRMLQLLLQLIMPKHPGPWHVVVLAGVIVACITCCLPVLLLLFPLPSLIFGFCTGFMTLAIIDVVAATLSFCIGRYIAQQPIRQFLHSKNYGRTMRLLYVLEREEESMQLLMLFRFLCIPMSVRNYAPSILSVPIPKLVLSTIPHSLWAGMVFAVVGTTLHEPATRLRDGHEFVFQTPQWQEIVGMVVAAVSFALFSWIAYCAYSRKMKEEEESGATAMALRMKGAEEGGGTTQYGAGMVRAIPTSGS